MQLSTGDQRFGKRRLASEEGCLNDLRSELKLIFKAFSEALEKYNKEISQTRPDARARGFEASLLNSKMIESVQNHFSNNWRFGRYKRFILSLNGYLILFKKLNGKDMPMNIKTQSVSAINNQMAFSLFGDVDYVIDPILYFGYKKNCYGAIIDPKLVYIDESRVRWAINESDIEMSDVFSVSTMIEDNIDDKATPKIRANKIKKSGT